MAAHPPIDVYLQAEFRAMDKQNKGYLSSTEFTNLMVYLGFTDKNTIEKILTEVDSDRDAKIQEKDFIATMHKYPQLISNTGIIRGMFQKFDRDNSGSALKKDVVSDLDDMGIYNDKIRTKIDAMDQNKDGNISYQDFLRIYFSGK